MYIGRQPTIGNFVVLDAITTSATTTFALTKDSVAYYPSSANHCIVSLNGIIQAPISSFTISGSNIVFSSALTSTDVIDFIQVLGDVLNIGTPSDNTVTSAKIVNGAITSSKLATGVGGKLLQVVTATDDTERTTTSTSFVTGSNTLSVSITPSSSSNKIFIIANHDLNNNTNRVNTFATIYRDSTNLGNSNGLSAIHIVDTDNKVHTSYSYLDSPSSTSALTYQVYFKCSSGTASLNKSARGTITAFEIAG